jgi:hypothetical protein
VLLEHDRTDPRLEATPQARHREVREVLRGGITLKVVIGLNGRNLFRVGHWIHPLEITTLAAHDVVVGDAKSQSRSLTAE